MTIPFQTETDTCGRASKRLENGLDRTFSEKEKKQKHFSVFCLLPEDTILPLSTRSFTNQRRAEVRFVTLEEKTVFDKKQSRIMGEARQIVEDGMVDLEASSSVGQIFAIKVWVFREPAAAKLHQDKNGHVELEVIHRKHDIDKVCLFQFDSWLDFFDPV